MFSGPGGDYGGPLRDRYQRVLKLADDDAQGRVLPRGAGSIDTSLMERDDRRDAERERLLMTPGVVRGGSTRTFSQPDSPLNVSHARSFDRYGESYSYDPMAAAEEIGSVEATKADAADRTRFESMQKMPGLTRAQAEQIVYGRNEPLDQDEQRRALAEFVRSPSRATAADAIEHGASQYAAPFNPGFDMALGERPRAPVLGSPEYRAAKAAELADREEQEKRLIELRAKLSVDNRPTPKARTYRYVGDDKKIHVVDLDTGKEISDSPTNVRQTAADADADIKRSLMPPVVGAAPVVPVRTPLPASHDALSDDAIATFIGGDAPTPAAKRGGKIPTAQQIAQAKKDPGYKAWLVGKGYTVP